MRIGIEKILVLARDGKKARQSLLVGEPTEQEKELAKIYECATRELYNLAKMELDQEIQDFENPPCQIVLDTKDEKVIRKFNKEKGCWVKIIEKKKDEINRLP